MTGDAIVQRTSEIARSPSGLIVDGRHFYALRVFYEDTGRERGRNRTGEQVVVGGDSELADGQRVRVAG